MIRSRMLALASVIVLLIFPASSPGQRARGVDQTQRQALVEAVQQLSAEFDAAVNAGDISKLRDKSDFFSGGSSLEPATLVAALTQTHSRNPVADAYIKWQLLSGLPDRLEGDLVRQAARAYASIPSLNPLPGVNARDRQQFEQMLMQLSEQQWMDANHQWLERMTEVDRANQPILRYRNELMRRLPINTDTVALMINDLTHRAAMGLDNRASTEYLLAAIRNWAAFDASPREIRVVHDLLLSARETPATTVPIGIEWRSNRAHFRTNNRRVFHGFSNDPNRDSVLILARELRDIASGEGLQLRN